MDPDELTATQPDAPESRPGAADAPLGPSVRVTASLGPSPAPTPTPSESPEPDPRLLDRLLKLADAYRAEDALRQATEMYFELAETYPHTPQGDQALKWLLSIAEHYEHAGARRQARSIYERLL